jgi:trk system potassium uptake protein TrkA
MEKQAVCPLKGSAMYIIVVGGGKVGYTLAQSLAIENNDVVIVDSDDSTIRRTSESLDVMTIRGNGLSAAVLRQAGVTDADLVIAVMDSDETNIVCCLTAKKLGAKHTIARIRDPEYALELGDLKDDFGIDMVINPELQAAVKISHVLRFASAVDVETFAGGRVEMVAFKVLPTDGLAGRAIADITPALPEPVLICAVERGDEVFIPGGSFVLEEKDKIHIIGKPTNTTAFSRFLKRPDKRLRNVMIVGGSRIAVYLIKHMTGTGMHFKLIEQSENRCTHLCELIPDATIILGDGTDEAVLESEGIRGMDAFVALTDRDEENLIAGLYATHLGLPKVVAKINRIGSMKVVDRLGIDSVLSPRMLTTDEIIRYVRALGSSQDSGFESLYRIVDDKVEALEFIAGESTRYLGVPLRALTDRIMPGTLIATIVRGDKTIIPLGGDAIEQGDRVIVITGTGSLSDLNDIFRRDVFRSEV